MHILGRQKLTFWPCLLAEEQTDSGEDIAQSVPAARAAQAAQGWAGGMPGSPVAGSRQAALTSALGCAFAALGGGEAFDGLACGLLPLASFEGDVGSPACCRTSTDDLSACKALILHLAGCADEDCRAAAQD